MPDQNEAPAGHEYVSTACLHGIHSRCVRSCKFCGAPCRCGCDHTPEAEGPLRRLLAAAIDRAADAAAALGPDADLHAVIVEHVIGALRAMPAKEKTADA